MIQWYEKGMHRSTIFFSGLATIFAILTGVVVWQLLAAEGEAEVTTTEPDFYELGLPDAKPRHRGRQYAARSVLLWDSATQTIRYEQNGFERLPIASLTKLMTAMVALDYGIDWEKQSTIELDEYVSGGRLLLHPGEQARVRDLFVASLLGSANNATLAYVRSLGIPTKEFQQAMNRKAVSLGLEQTHFADTTGLDKNNVSTAYEVARLAEHAFAHYPDIARATQQSEYTFRLHGSDREHTIRNTNKLIADGGDTYSGSKTGYIYESRYCLVVRGAGEKATLIGVVLGSPSEPDNFFAMQQLLRL